MIKNSKSVVVAEEEKVTMNLLEPKPPQEIVSERTILERPRFVLEVVRTERDKKVYLCDFCMKGFSSCQALGGHQNCHKKEREIKKKLKLIDQMLSNDTYRVPFGSYGGMSFGTFKYGGWGSSSSSRSNRPYLFSTGGGAKKMKTTMFPPLAQDRSLTRSTGYSSSTRYPLIPKKYTSNAFSTDDDINLDLTLGPSKPIGDSSNSINNNTNSSFGWGFTRGTRNLTTPVCPRVSRFNFVAGNLVDSFTGRYVPPFGNTNLCHDLFSLQGNGMGSSHPKSLFSMGMSSKAMVPPFAPPYLTSTNLFNDLFSSQENGMGSNHSRIVLSREMNKVKVPRFAPSYPMSTNLCNDSFPLQENGLGSGQSKSPISKGKNKVMVLEDDDGKDIGIRWLTKEKRSGRRRS